MDTALLEARNFNDPEACTKRLQIHLRLDLESVRVELGQWQDALPERDVSVANV